MKAGNIIDSKGKILGKHEGLPLYTIGQRGGLEIGGNGPYYVVGKNEKKNTVIVSNDAHDPLLWRKECIVSDITWTHALEIPKQCEVSIRYRHPAYPATIEVLKNRKLKLIFNESQRAITPGQLAVFYKADELLGSAVIEEVL
jgi:tRNA-specific 2-thiouridylase